MVKYKRRNKNAKAITQKDYLATQKDNRLSCDIEDILCKDYVYILDAMDEEDFEYYDTSFDIFQEIIFENKVVGFVSYMVEDYGYNLIEAYVMPKFRGNNLLFDEIDSKLNSNIMVSINKPQISLVNALIENNLCRKVNDDIVVCDLIFNSSSYDLKKSSENHFKDYLSQIYDLKHGCILYLDIELNYTKANPKDIKKYNLELEISDDYLNDVRELILNNDEYGEGVLETIQRESQLNIVFR